LDAPEAVEQPQTFAEEQTRGAANLWARCRARHCGPLILFAWAENRDPADLDEATDA
jgi:hypothetical protein